MKVKYIAVTLAASFLIALFLLFLWKAGVLGAGQAIPADIRSKISNGEGIYAELNITPEAGILTGDILDVALNVFFNHSLKKVDEKLVAERYITLKESEFAGCEEYGYPELDRKNTGKITRISLLAKFQCFFTTSQEKSINIMVQYANKENSETSNLNLTKRISFAAIPVRASRDFANHAHDSKSIGLWLLALGAGFFIASLAVTGMYAAYKKYIKPPTREAPEPEQDYFSRKVAALQADLSVKDPRSILDKLYHLCCQVLEEEARLQCQQGKLTALRGGQGANGKLESLKKDLEIIYDPSVSIEEDSAEHYLDEAERISKNGGEAK